MTGAPAEDSFEDWDLGIADLVAKSHLYGWEKQTAIAVNTEVLARGRERIVISRNGPNREVTEISYRHPHQLLVSWRNFTREAKLHAQLHGMLVYKVCQLRLDPEPEPVENEEAGDAREA